MSVLTDLHNYFTHILMSLYNTLIPESPDLAIFVMTDGQADKTDHFIPCACMQGKMYLQIILTLRYI